MPSIVPSIWSGHARRSGLSAGRSFFALPVPRLKSRRSRISNRIVLLDQSRSRHEANLADTHAAERWRPSERLTVAVELHLVQPASPAGTLLAVTGLQG